jgi:hypothetical protein
MKPLFFYLFLLSVGVFIGYYSAMPDGKEIDQLITEKEKLTEYNRILVISNAKLKNSSDKRITEQENKTDSLNKLQ